MEWMMSGPVGPGTVDGSISVQTAMVIGRCGKLRLREVNHHRLRGMADAKHSNPLMASSFITVRDSVFQAFGKYQLRAARNSLFSMVRCRAFGRYRIRESTTSPQLAILTRLNSWTLRRGEQARSQP